MLRIIQLLQEKNHYLEKFYSLNETEIINFSMGRFENLENFYNTRERILEILRYIDDQIALVNTEAEQVHQYSPDELHQVKVAMNIKEEYVSRILKQDLEVLSLIEAAKSNIIRELQDVRRVRKAVSGYKSPTFTKRLDEEV